MRELRCVIGDIFTKCGKNPTRKNVLSTRGASISAIPPVSNVESHTDRTQGIGFYVSDIVWMIDRFNEFGYDVLSIVDNDNLWEPRKNKFMAYRTVDTGAGYHYFKVRKIEDVDLI